MSFYLLTMLLVMPLRSKRNWLLGGAVTIAGAAMVAVTLVPKNPLLTNLGMYVSGVPTGPLDDLEVEYFVEGASSNVLVARYAGKHVSLHINGKADASDGADMATQAGLAYLPRLFRPDAHNVMVIGFGSGTTPGASLLFPDTDVTCCEIEPAVFKAAGSFAPCEPSSLRENATIPRIHQ